MKQIKKMFQKDYIYDPVMHQYHELLRNFYFLSLHLVVWGYFKIPLWVKEIVWFKYYISQKWLLKCVFFFILVYSQT
jgi:hypothetical protein